MLIFYEYAGVNIEMNEEKTYNAQMQMRTKIVRRSHPCSKNQPRIHAHVSFYSTVYNLIVRCVRFIQQCSRDYVISYESLGVKIKTNLQGVQMKVGQILDTGQLPVRIGTGDAHTRRRERVIVVPVRRLCTGPVPISGGALRRSNCRNSVGIHTWRREDVVLLWVLKDCHHATPSRANDKACRSE